MKISTILSVFLVAVPLTAMCQTNNKDEKSFVVFDNASSEIPYRIPAIASNREGDLIAVADYRYSGQDIGVVPGGKLDLRYRIKDHTTGEWGEVMTLAAANGEGDEFIAFGDPCIVADRESDMVLVTSCSGNVSFQAGTHENHQGWARFISNDGGKTWSEFEDISQQVFDQLDKRTDGQIQAFFIGSGKILQSKKVKNGDTYRLYCAALVKTNGGKYVNYVFYSDDFGKKWELLGEANDCPIENGDEPKVEELPNGDILLSSRVRGGRKYNIYHFKDLATATGKWDKTALSNKENNGVLASQNACNGEVLMMEAVDNATGNNVDILLQSVPFGPDNRTNVGINYKVLSNTDNYNSSENISKDWNGTFEVSDATGAYSTMTTDKDGNVAFLFEENVYNGGYDIVYRSLTLDEITGGKYSVKK